MIFDMTPHPPFTATDADLALAAQHREWQQRRMEREASMDRYVEQMADERGHDDDEDDL